MSPAALRIAPTRARSIFTSTGSPSTCFLGYRPRAYTHCAFSRIARAAARSRAVSGISASPRHETLAELPDPAAETLMERRCSNDHGVYRPFGGMKDERVGLLSPKSAVRADLRLERGDLTRRAVEGAHDDEVAALRHGVDAAQARLRIRAKRGDGIAVLDVVIGEAARAACAENDSAVVHVAHHDEPDARMPDQAVHEVG